MSVDPLTLAVVSGALVATAEEMGTAIRNTAFSDVVREGEDCSASLFDRNGRMIAQGNFAPGHLGTAAVAVQAVFDRFPVDEMRPGDAYILNDPAYNSGHLPDIFMIAPVHRDDEVVALSVLTAHHVDVGGAAPGSQAVVGVVDIHQEGLRITPCRFIVDRTPVPALVELIRANVRMPIQVIGDLQAQYSAARAGERQLLSLIDRIGIDTYDAVASAVLDGSERAMREAITAIPDGSYSFESGMDDSGPGTPPLRINVTVNVSGDEIAVDFEGTSPATRSGVNTYLPYTEAYTHHTLKCVLAPAVQQNSGCRRPVSVQAPAGCFLNAQYPTPSGARALLASPIVDALLGALAAIVPDRVQASSSQLINTMMGGLDAQTGKPFVFYDTTHGSTGARPGKDGCDGLVAGFNARNVPVETYEARWPVLVESLGFVTDSAGPGAYRGGTAVQRQVRNLGGAGTFTTLHDRHYSPAWGLFGGKAGGPGRMVLNPGTAVERELPSKGIHDLELDDVVLMRTCGGGGWGDPFERDPEAVLEDVRNGWVSLDAAREHYGVVLELADDDVVLDLPGTIDLRRVARQEQAVS